MPAERQVVFGKRTALIEEEIQKVVTDDGAPLALVHKRAAEIGSYSPLSTKLAGVNLILIHGLGQNRLTYDLPAISPANYFAEMSMEVWIAELRGHGLSRELGSPVPESFEDYIKLDVPAILRHISMVNDKPIFVLGHSLGGTILYCLDPNTCGNVAGFISVAGPYHFAKGLFLFRLMSFILHHTYRLNPLQLLASKDIPFPLAPFSKVFKGGRFLFDHPKFPQLYRIWQPQSMSDEILADRLDRGFDQTSLAVVKRMILWASTGRLTDGDGNAVYDEVFKAKSQPFFFVQGSGDSSVPLKSIQCALDSYEGPRTLRIFGSADGEPDFGHIDLLTGNDAPKYTWPAILEWMAEQL